MKYEVVIYWSSEDKAFVAEVPELPGCVADGKTYAQALRNVEQAQELAESRRLFYVAATRAKERLILAGRQPKQKKDGEWHQLVESWQKWLEESLGLTPEDKQKGVWENPAHHFKISIITEAGPETEKLEASPTSPPERIHLEYIHERTRSPSMATTGLETMRKSWQDKRDEWWLRYRVKVRPHMPKPGKRELEDGDENLGPVMGTLVHRLFEMKELLRTSPEERRPLLKAMAQNQLSNGQREETADGEEESVVVASPAVDRVVSGVEEILEIICAKGNERVRELLEAPGEPEVEFLLQVGRWHITGRFDKLLPHPSGGYEIVDWKTDREPNWQDIVRRYREKQMRLYALALVRVGRAALIDGAVQVHLALLHHGRVETLRFPLQELEEFASDLEKELQEMEQFGE